MDARTEAPRPRAEEPWTLLRLINWTSTFLAEKRGEPARTARLDAEVLLAHTLGCKRIELYTRSEETASEETRGQFRALVKQRAEGCPVAYLVGKKEFFSLTFEVGPAVLIPRPDTEDLVNECYRLTKPLAEPRILDLGTGSGNIPIALAKQHKGAQLVTVDMSSEALALAQRNARTHAVDSRIRFLEGDLFGPIPEGELFDLIASNPPYIPTGDIPGLDRGVRDFEPHQALDGGPDGFAFFARIVAGAPRFLKPGGYLVLEIGSPQEIEARRRIETTPGYTLGPTLKDGAGHPRVLRARWNGEQSVS